jgi:uncharacterized protein with NRDE domain
MMNQPLQNTRKGIIKNFIIPPKVSIGDWHEVTAVFQGSVKSGYFSLMLQDRDGIKQWFPDINSMIQKLSDSGENIHTGTLNFSDGLYESKWKFRPTTPLYKGQAKAVVQMFEDSNVYPLTFQEKDIRLV